MVISGHAILCFWMKKLVAQRVMHVFLVVKKLVRKPWIIVHYCLLHPCTMLCVYIQVPSDTLSGCGDVKS